MRDQTGGAVQDAGAVGGVARGDVEAVGDLVEQHPRPHRVPLPQFDEQLAGLAVQALLGQAASGALTACRGG